MPSGCYLALHVDVFTAGCYIPGPVIKHKGGVGVLTLSCVIVEGISLEALQLVIMVWTLLLPQLRAWVGCTVRLVFVTALDGFCLRAGLDEHRRGRGSLRDVIFSAIECTISMHSEVQSPSCLVPEVQVVLVSYTVQH